MGLVILAQPLVAAEGFEGRGNVGQVARGQEDDDRPDQDDDQAGLQRGLDQCLSFLVQLGIAGLDALQREAGNRFVDVQDVFGEMRVEHLRIVDVAAGDRRVDGDDVGRGNGQLPIALKIAHGFFQGFLQFRVRVFGQHALEVGIHLGHGVDHGGVHLIGASFIDLAGFGLTQHSDQQFLRREHVVAQAVAQAFEVEISLLCGGSRVEIVVIQGKGAPAEEGGNADADHQGQEKDQEALDAVFHISGSASRSTRQAGCWRHTRTPPARVAQKRPACLPA